MQRTEARPNILLVEDDVNLGFLLVENLKAKGFEVTLIQDGALALSSVKEVKAELFVIDIMLPGADGFSVAEAYRKAYPKTPFIFLTARIQEQDKLQGFEAGADDYITKPFSFKELYYRILVSLRRSRPELIRGEEEALTIAGLTLYPAQRLLVIAGQKKKLSRRESGLLQILLEHQGRYVPRGEILKRVWGNDDFFTAKSMDVYVTRIRKLLKEAPALEIENLYGTGYRIRVHQTEDESRKTFSG